MEYIFLHGRPPAIMGDILKIRLPTYNLITCQELDSGNQKTVRYSTKTISFFGSKNLGNSSSKYKKVHLSELLCGIVDWRRAFTFISSRDLCQRGGRRSRQQRRSPNLRVRTLWMVSTSIQALMNEFVQQWCTTTQNLR